MSKLFKTTLMSLVILLIILAPACRSSRKKVDGGSTTTTAESTAPDVTMPPTDTGTPVASNTDDFVRTDPPEPVTETMPTDIEELNKYAQQRGYLRDAFFNYDEATLDEAAQSALSSSANWLKSKDGASYNLLVEGHCDERGTEQYNLALGDRRANSVKDYLATLGVDAGRIRTVSYGEERPFEEGHDDASWAQNRRAHLVLVR